MLSIALDVSIQFGNPIIDPRLWHTAIDASLVLMPEAAMDKNHRPAPGKNNVGPSR